jgi:hypothetical protein
VCSEVKCGAVLFVLQQSKSAIIVFVCLCAIINNVSGDFSLAEDFSHRILPKIDLVSAHRQKSRCKSIIADRQKTIGRAQKKKAGCRQPTTDI